MKQLINKLLALGLVTGQNPHEARMIRTTNILNLAVIIFTTCSFSTALFLGRKYDLYPILLVFLFAVVSFILNSYNKSKSAYMLFAVYINLTICYFTIAHPKETDMYIYFFPVIVSLVLLNTASTKGYSVTFTAFICALAITLSFCIEVPSIHIDLNATQIKNLQRFNVISASVITAVLSFILTRIISRQFDEITAQNTDLIRTKELVNASLKEKEVLLAELHHRVKNNLAIISGLLNLQDDATSSAEAKEVIRDSKSRIMSMALVHRMLYEKTELKSLDLCNYTSELVHELLNSYDLSERVTVVQTCAQITLPVNKSVPLGLILNEIVTNSIKYAYKRRKNSGGQFDIAIHQSGNEVKMLVKDDGEGFPSDFDPDSENVSLGIFLIKTLSEQIDGTVRFFNEGGACIEVCFLLQE